MLNRFIRYLKGYLRICISGKSIERFINTCSYRGIFLWDLTSCSSEYEMNIAIKDFKKLKPVIRKTGAKVHIVKRTGFPFFLQKYHRRKTFFIGFILCLIIIYGMSLHIWSIKISGNLHNTDENLINFLETINVRTGMRQKDINCSNIAKAIRHEYDDIIWVSASLEGSNLILQIKEVENTNMIYKSENTMNSEPYDIIADQTCQISRIIVRKGIAQVKEGDYVKKGDILISGQIPIYNDAKEITQYAHCISDADIWGNTFTVYEDEMKYTNYEKDYSKISKQIYSLKIGKWRFIFGDRNNSYTHFENYIYQKKWKGITIEIEYIYPYSQIENNYTQTEAQQILSDNYRYYCQQLEKKGVEILENDVKIYTWSDKAKATGHLTLKIPIGQLQKSRLIEIGENIDGNDGNYN